MNLILSITLLSLVFNGSLFSILPIFTIIFTDVFNILKTKRIYNCGYVIMPNHLYGLIYTRNEVDIINFFIGETKRFMSYEIVKKLKKKRRYDLLEKMRNSVSLNEIKKSKIHNVFEPSADIKEILTEKFIRQKLNYMHKNPVSGKWSAAAD